MNNDKAKETTAVVTGLGLVCFGLFLLVSLYTNSPYDVMDYHAGYSGELENKAGWIGAQMAHYAFCMYGVGAWVIMALTVFLGIAMCSMRSMTGLLNRAIGSVVIIGLVCAWCGAMRRPVFFSSGYPAGPGGLLGGTLLAPPLIGYFGQVGVFLVLSIVSLLACLLMAQAQTEAALSFFGRGIVNVSHVLGDWIIGRMPNATAEQPAAASAMMPLPALSTASANANTMPAAEVARARINTAEINLGGQAPAAAPSRRKNDVPEAPDLRKAETAERVIPLLKPRKEERIERIKDLKEKEKEKEKEEEVSAEEKVKAEKRQSKAELEAATEAEETERRRQEAMRQAEAAEAERLQREKESREQYQKEAKALEKLEKERAAHDKERAKQQEKFAAAMAEAAAAKADAEAAPADATPEKTEPPKPKVPINYDLPKYDVLIQNDISPEVSSDSHKERGATVVQTLWDFKIGTKLVGIQTGPTVTMYELELDPGIKVQRVVSLQDNLAMAMKAENGVRIIAPIPGKATIGIEIPNTDEHTVRMRPVLESPAFRGKNWTLPLVLGRDAVGNPLVADLASMPHLLIAGTTGSGKSVCVNSIILSIMILRKPHEVKLILVDPKQVEMTDFKGIPHLLSPVVTDMKLAAGVLTWAVKKMEERYERMSHVGVRNIATFNRMTREERLARLPQDACPDDYVDPMPYIVIIVDEFADLMMTAGKEIEQAIARLAQKARAAGIHVILATQRPSADVVTGLIKTNLPCRICFQVKSKIDSRIVLDQGGAEKLAGKGDMLFIGAGNSNLVRAKGVYIADDEIRGVVQFCKNQAEPEYSDEVERVAAAAGAGEEGEPAVENNRQAIELDEKFDEAVEVFLACGRASTSLLQRRMGLGYTRAAKLCDQMQARGIVGPDRGAKGRELLISQEAWDEYKRVRANNNGSAFGPKGSKDNPGTASGDVPAAAPAAEPSVPAAKSGEELNPALIAQLANVDGVKDDEEEDAPSA
jgi:S-DNA-T family DNA segregation ATPase FtsK/SpoIIIE